MGATVSCPGAAGASIYHLDTWHKSQSAFPDTAGVAIYGLKEEVLTGVMMKVYGAKDHLATVVDTELLTPHFVRVRMHPQTLFGDPKAIIAPAAYLRFWFPDPSGSGHESTSKGYTISEATPTGGKITVRCRLCAP